MLRSLQTAIVHVVGHSSGALIALQLAADHPQFVQSLTLIEPAPLGPFQVPAFAELGQQFIGPAIAAFSGGDLPGALDRFLLGVGGPDYRGVVERSLGRDALDDVLRESSFFFSNEIFRPRCNGNSEWPMLPELRRQYWWWRARKDGVWGRSASR